MPSDLVDDELPTHGQWTSTVLYELPFNRARNGIEVENDGHQSNDSYSQQAHALDNHHLVIDIHAHRTAIAMGNQNDCVHVIDHRHSPSVTMSMAQTPRRRLQDRTNTMCKAMDSDNNSKDTVVKNCRNDGVVIHVKEEVVDLAFSPCGCYLAIADQLGNLHLYKSMGERLFSYPVLKSESADRVTSLTFAATDNKSPQLQDLFVVTKSGTLLRLGNLALVEMEQTLLQDPVNAFNSILQRVQFQSIQAGPLHKGESVCSCLVAHRFQSSVYVVLANHEEFLSVWKAKTLKITTSSAAIKRISAYSSQEASEFVQDMHFGDNGRVLIVLSHQGTLTWWDWHDMIRLSQLYVPYIRSFAILDNSPMDSSKPSASSLIMSRWTGKEKSTTVVEMTQVVHKAARKLGNYRVELKILDSKESITPSIHLGAATDDEADVDHSSFIVISSTDRGVTVLKSTLNSDSVELTNNIANSREQGIDTVATPQGDRVDAVSIAASLASTSIPSLSAAEMREFKDQLDLCTAKIGEIEEESRAILMHLLEIAGQLRMLASQSVLPCQLVPGIIEWCVQISDISYKWTTFQLLLCSITTEHPSLQKQYLKQKWHAFQTTDITDMLESYMKKGAMRAVKILWRRHLNNTMVRNICKLLHWLPNSLPVAVYDDWVRNDVIPALINHVEKTFSTSSNGHDEYEASLLFDIVQWLLERAEHVAENGDTASAIKLCNLIKTAGQKDGSGSEGYTFLEFKLQISSKHPPAKQISEQNQTDQVDAFRKLELLGEKLHHIEHLAQHHRFKISLSMFLEETPSTIAMSMLDRVSSPEMLENEIKLHVKKYLQFCEVECDPVLRDYVFELAEGFQNTQSIQETRALTIMDTISNIEMRVEAALAVFGSVRPPYSRAIKEYAKKCALSWNTPRREEIEEHVRLMEIQDMLMAYGIKQFNIADARHASRLLDHILAQISRSTALQDAMRLVDAYSHLDCDRAVVQYIENLLTIPVSIDTMCSRDAIDAEISARSKMAASALITMKKRHNQGSQAMTMVSLMEEIVMLGLTLLEMEEAEKGPETTLGSFDSDGDERMRESDDAESCSFVLGMLEAMVAGFLPQICELQDLATSTSDDDVLSYIANPDFTLNEQLLTDLQKLRRIEKEYKMLLSISTLRNPENQEMKVKSLINLNIMFAGDITSTDGDTIKAQFIEPTSNVARGKKKKRAAGWDGQNVIAYDAKRIRSEGITRDLHPPARLQRGKQRDDKEAQYTSTLNRFASAIGMPPSIYQALIAQSAAQHGCILRAVRYSRDLFSRRCSVSSNDFTSRTDSTLTASDCTAQNAEIKFQSAETLKRISMSISLYTATHVEELYTLLGTKSMHQSPSQTARLRAPTYSLELLQYAICVCDMDSFEETLLLLKNAAHLNEVLQFTHIDVDGREPYSDMLEKWRLYRRWFRGDSCVLNTSQTMKLATRFAIEDHKILVNRSDSEDFIASKRYVSFLVENHANLLSLKVLFSLRTILEDAVSVIQDLVGKVLSTVFQSEHIDNHFALGLMLTMEQQDAFNAFRRQISRENIVKDFNRFQQLAIIGADAARAWEQMAFLHQCVELEGNAKWWHYLNLLGIECDHKAFQSARRDLDYIRRLVPLLLVKSNFDFYTVLEFTRHYQIEDSFPSIVFVEALLLQENPPANLEYQDKIVGVLEDIHDQHLIALLLKSIPRISGTDYDRLLFVFRLLLENTSYKEKDEVERRIEVLLTLKAFSRFQSRNELNVKSSDDMKNHDAESEMSDSTTSNSREEKTIKTVSFHELIARPRELMAQLVDSENFSILVSLAGPLRLEPDEVHMLLLKDMVQSQVRQNKVLGLEEESQLSPVDFRTFEDILTRLTTLENKVTASEWLAEHFPFGQEKLKALEFALRVALSEETRQLASKDEDVHSSAIFTGIEALTRLKAKILRLKIELIMCNGTVQDKKLRAHFSGKTAANDLLKLIGQPKDLFFELYQRYSLLFFEESSEALHEIADNVANLLGLPGDKLRMELVQEWLVKDALRKSNPQQRDTSAENEFELLEDEQLLQVDEKYIKMILFIASKCMDDDKSAISSELVGTLYRFAMETKPRAGVTFRAKKRALRVLLRLGQLYITMVANIIMKECNGASVEGFVRDLMMYTKHCTHMIHFEEHRVPIEMETFIKADKEALTRSILRQFSIHRPWVLRCTSRLMLDFDVGAADLWETVLGSMARLKMNRSLSSILEPLCVKPFMRMLENGTRIWEDVLLSPLLKLKEKCQNNQHSIQMHFDTNDFGKSLDASCQVRREEQDDSKLSFGGFPVSNIRSVLERRVVLLQICPCLDQIDVTAFVIHLRDLTEMAQRENNGDALIKELDLYGFAVSCAMVIPKPQTRFEALMRIIQSGAYIPVLRALLDTSCLLNGDHNESLVNVEEDENEFAEQFRLVQGIFAEAAKRNGYRDLLETPFEQGFMEFLAASANIDGLLAVLLSEKRLEAASNVVELYYEFHHAGAISLDTNELPSTEEEDSSNRWRLLRTYLATSSSSNLEQFRNAL